MWLANNQRIQERTHVSAVVFLVYSHTKQDTLKLNKCNHSLSVGRKMTSFRPTDDDDFCMNFKGSSELPHCLACRMVIY
jgi:hypothetical protein